MKRSFELLLLFGVGLLLTGTIQAQNSEKKILMKKLPAAVQQTVREQSKGATIKGFAAEKKAGKTFYEVEMNVSGHTKDLLIDANGTVVEIEEVALATLPASVKAGLEREAGKSKILKVESITKNATIVYYEAEIRRRGKAAEIKVGPDGAAMSGK